MRKHVPARVRAHACACAHVRVCESAAYPLRPPWEADCPPRVISAAKRAATEAVLTLSCSVYSLMMLDHSFKHMFNAVSCKWMID